MKKIAVATLRGQLTAHFGHCEKFAIIEATDGIPGKIEFVDPPVHQPGVYPRFLASLGVDVIIAGGMGQKAQDLFASNNIEVIMGIGEGDPEDLAKKYLNKQLQSGDNLCDH